MNKSLLNFMKIDYNLVQFMNKLICCTKNLNLHLNKKKFRINFDFNIIKNGGNFIEVKFTINNADCNILIPELSFKKLISSVNDNIDLEKLPSNLITELSYCLIDDFLLEIQSNLGLDINYIAINNIFIEDISNYKLNMLLSDNTNNINMILDLNQDSEDVLNDLMNNYPKTNQLKCLPNIPIVAKLTLGGMKLNMKHVISHSPESLKINDVLVIPKDIDNFFVSIFDRFFYKAKLIDQAKVVIYHDNECILNKYTKN